MNNQSNETQKIIYDDEIDLKNFLNLIIKQRLVIALSSIIFFVIFCIYALMQKRVWEGKFEIVVEQQDQSLAANLIGGGNPSQNFLNNISLFGGTSSLDTEVEILKSPSVLLPIYDYVNNERRKTNNNYVEIPFEKWKKQNLDIKLKPRTSILNISYKDSNKEIILPVLSRVSSAYQVYSGRRIKRKILLSSEYLNSQIKKYKLQSSESLKKAQEFALDEDLTLFDANTDKSMFKADNQIESKENIFNQFPSNLNFEELRVKQLVKIKNIDKQIEQIKALENDYEQVQFIANNLEGLVPSIINDLNKIETNLVEARSKYTEKDRSIKRLLDKREILLKLLKERSIANLNALRTIEKAKMEAVSRPKNIVLKYKELVRNAARDEATLVELENQLRIINLEQARYKEPWELITKPTLTKSPIAPRRKRIGILGFIFGIFAGISYVTIKENLTRMNKSGKKND